MKESVGQWPGTGMRVTETEGANPGELHCLRVTGNASLLRIGMPVRNSASINWTGPSIRSSVILMQPWKALLGS